MSPTELTLFILLASLGSFVQALSGFALGLIVLGSVTLLSLAPIPFTAAVISLISLANGGWVLARHPRAIHWPSVGWITLGLIPMIGVGMALLAHMDSELPTQLRQLAGAAILLAGIVLMLKPHARPQASGRLPTLLSGMAGGVLGGLFSTAGPPVVYHLYRQPWTLSAIRSTLLTVFVLSTLARIVWQLLRGEFRWDMLEVALYCTLPVIITAQLGARLAPRIPHRPMRQLAFILLALTGIGLLVPTSEPVPANIASTASPDVMVTVSDNPTENSTNEWPAPATLPATDSKPRSQRSVSASPVASNPGG